MSHQAFSVYLRLYAAMLESVYFIHSKVALATEGSDPLFLNKDRTPKARLRWFTRHRHNMQTKELCFY